MMGNRSEAGGTKKPGGVPFEKDVCGMDQRQRSLKPPLTRAGTREGAPRASFSFGPRL